MTEEQISKLDLDNKIFMNILLKTLPYWKEDFFNDINYKENVKNILRKENYSESDIITTFEIMKNGKNFKGKFKMLQEIKMLSSEFQPRGKYVFVKPDIVNLEEKTNTGIILSSKKSITDRPVSGVILAVGNEVEDLKVGDYVIFPSTDGIDLKFEDSDTLIEQPQYMLLRNESIIGLKKI